MNRPEKTYWQSLDQKRDGKAYRRRLLREYEESTRTPSQVSRRDFLAVMGASLALAGLAGCRRPVEKIIPYVAQPEEIIPGIANYYATTMPLGTSAYGLIVECHEGRPTKIEGNPHHPTTRGATDHLIQAAILGLYDPDRSGKVLHTGAEKTFDDFVAFWLEQYDTFINNKGEGLAILSESFASPTLARLKRQFQNTFPKAIWISHEPLDNEHIRQATERLAGKTLEPRYDFAKAGIILAVDSDFLYGEGDHLIAAADFASRRGTADAHGTMNRLYAVESAFTVTGSMADHRRPGVPNMIGNYVLAVATELKRRGKYPYDDLPGRLHGALDHAWLKAVVDDLVDAGPDGLILAGNRQPAWVHELIIKIQSGLGQVGSTVKYVRRNDVSYSRLSDLNRLVNNMRDGNVTTLVMLGGNPVYSAPKDFGFASALQKVTHSIHLSAYVDETSRLAEWHLPRAHFLESWGDAVAIDGTASVIQPMIAPLFDGHSDVELFSLLATGTAERAYDMVRTTWQDKIKNDFESGWRRILHDGINTTDGNTSEIVDFRPDANLDITIPMTTPTTDSLDVVYIPSALYDGRFANNGWLQEFPDPITKLAWDNAALVSAATADSLQVTNGDLVLLALKEHEVRLPIWICPGLAGNTVVLPLGYGRDTIGRVADGVGFDTYKVRLSDGMYIARGATLQKTGETYVMATTQDHNRMADRPIVREGTLTEYQEHPEFAKEMVEHPPLKSIYREHDYSTGYQWGMVIDLNKCIGCGACTIACQCENNIPIVGKEQVHHGREMHWVRIDRYFAGDENDPAIVHMPVPCQQCENAPCESVCPVAATVHDKEGLNNMTYNRCIGTRYCSNNCPYKVRRFNFFNYTSDMPEVVRMAQNPDVTVRFRGVMEKCTFCTQRISRAKIKANQDGRELVDGEVQTACQQACPTKAIAFGNINDADSHVTGLKRLPRNYALLGEFNTKPRTSYLAKLRNPHPLLERRAKKTGHDIDHG
ncbi:MAG: TAT-variant-translocated molybdopterin oxidoreductase [candidate division Zixibacteria bacterium]|nr:TAT-variant-translocated molybdopterin oxidoreductase [candidate division Zixibacteria bacterium]